jgi:hypothetical protein
LNIENLFSLFIIYFYFCSIILQKTIIMATAVKKQSASTAKRTQSAVLQNGEQPKRLSKYALWRKENPDGIGTVIDWRAVNR